MSPSFRPSLSPTKSPTPPTSGGLNDNGEVPPTDAPVQAPTFALGALVEIVNCEIHNSETTCNANQDNKATACTLVPNQACEWDADQSRAELTFKLKIMGVDNAAYALLDVLGKSPDVALKKFVKLSYFDELSVDLASVHMDVSEEASETVLSFSRIYSSSRTELALYKNWLDAQGTDLTDLIVTDYVFNVMAGRLEIGSAAGSSIEVHTMAQVSASANGACKCVDEEGAVVDPISGASHLVSSLLALVMVLFWVV